MTEKGRNKKSISGLIRWILIAVCAIVFCGSAAHLLFYAKDKLDAEKAFEQTRNRDLAELYAENSDLIGWIQIEGTKIDYPVMQTPDDPEYYLHRDFNREYSASGTPFLDAASVVLSKDNAVTWNWLIYGHNMKFGTMFHDLQEYDSQEFWENHRTFSFDVYDPSTGLTDNGEYEIFAASRSRIREDDSQAFGYYQFAGYSDEDTFYEYVDGVKGESAYETGITPQFGEQLVTLSTCAYHTDEGRFYIVGRRIR